MNFRRLNLITGWSVFLFSTIVYLLTLEPTASLWDCGEYITAAYKLEVGHPPGAPFFMLIGRLFSFFAAPQNVALLINTLSAISSSLTILFMFWSLTILLKKMVLARKQDLSSTDQGMIIISATIASLAYTFSDSFWFSAVEGEVYAMASLFTAVIFWAGLKWDEEMSDGSTLKNDSLAANRWLILILFLLGLAVGVHLLGILVVPAIAFILYFNQTPKPTLKGILITGLLSVLILGFIQEGVIPGSIALASWLEVRFVNSFGLPFFSGAITFFVLLVGGFYYAIRYAQQNQKTLLYNSLMGLAVLLIGYGSFAVIVIRSDANTPLDENDPENLVNLHSYLKREQYGSAPLLKGPYWNSTPAEVGGDFSPTYVRRFVVEKDGEVVKAFQKESDAEAWKAKNSKDAEITEKYFESNAESRIGRVPEYEQNTLFPRMYDGNQPQKVEGYKSWSGYNAKDGKETDLGANDERLPTMGENLTYFMRYQTDWMYIRYLLWNFSGRQNDVQGNGDNLRGNWISGIDFVDSPRLGSANDQPSFIQKNAANNRFYLLPLTFILLGLMFHFYRAPKDAFIILLAFVFTGIAIVVYLNQKPFEPRERDYAYAGSFYFFAMWLAFGVYALYDFYQSITKMDLRFVGYFTGGGLLVGAVFGYGRLWLVVALLLGVLLGISYLLKKVSPNGTLGAFGISIIGLGVPILMGTQGWEDHNRNGKTTARDLAHNYLSSCKKNAILFTAGDNDTFPLWYLQEVEGERTDVRVCNLSLLSSDWYTYQMKLKMYQSNALPISFKEDEILSNAGITDYARVYTSNLRFEAPQSINQNLDSLMVPLRFKNNKRTAEMALRKFINDVEKLSVDFPLIKNNPADFSRITSFDSTKMEASLGNALYGMNGILKSLTNTQTQEAKMALEQFKSLSEAFDASWASIDIKDAIAFYKTNGYIPSDMISIPVNKKNALKSGIIKDTTECIDRIDIKMSLKSNYPVLNRDQIIMMDVIANNNWERPIYFSESCFGTDHPFAAGLAESSFGKDVGTVDVLSPKITNTTNGLAPMDADEMYNNLMNVYRYGNVKNPGVMSDYHVRIHMEAFRRKFLSLAAYYYEVKKPERAVQLLDRCMIELPPHALADLGNERTNYCVLPINKKISQNELGRSFLMSEGSLNEFVQLYFLCDASAKGIALANQLLQEYSSILQYYKNTPAEIALQSNNADDLYTTLAALCRIENTLKTKGNASTKPLSSKINGMVKPWFTTVLTSKKLELQNLNTESSDNFSQMSAFFDQKMNELGQHFGYISTPTETNQGLKDLPGQTPSAVNPVSSGNNASVNVKPSK
ncbi:MAG: hypothetical protein RIQ90_860 [Bacteroidota bacterium]